MKTLRLCRARTPIVCLPPVFSFVFSLVLPLIFCGTDALGQDVKSFYVDGQGGVPLAVTDAGPKDGPEILFLHGLGHSRASFSPQMESALAERYHMVAFDLRGHGQSGKPWRDEDYADPDIWADDVRRVMDATGLRRPIVVAWSYGGLVAADMIRTHGGASLSGLMLVNTTGGLVNVPASNADMEMPADLTEAYRLMAEPTYANQRQAVINISNYLVAETAVPGWLDQSLELGLMLPPYVRARLRAHRTDNTDLAREIAVPVVLAYGDEDASVRQEVVAALLAAIPNSAELRFEGAGHSPFAEDVERFNRALAAFVDQNWKRTNTP